MIGRNKFVKLEEIGSGQFGTVYKVRSHFRSGAPIIIRTSIFFVTFKPLLFVLSVRLTLPLAPPLPFLRAKFSNDSSFAINPLPAGSGISQQVSYCVCHQGMLVDPRFVFFLLSPCTLTTSVACILCMYA